MHYLGIGFVCSFTTPMHKQYIITVHLLAQHPSKRDRERTFLGKMVFIYRKSMYKETFTMVKTQLIIITVVICSASSTVMP